MSAAKGSAVPLVSSVLLELTKLGIAQPQIIFKNVTLSSSKYVTVREEEGGAPKSVAVADTTTKNMLRLPIKVDSAIMNPVSKVVAVRVGGALQITNLEMKVTMKQATLNEPVVFWKWLDTKTVAIVTAQSVYHWSAEGTTEPAKVFDRTPCETPVQIINYRASADQKWLILGGITQSPTGQVQGHLQVYSVDMKTSQPPMDAHAATFALVNIDGRDKPSNLFCFTRVTPAGPRLNIMEVGVPKEQAFTQSASIQLADGDFPLALIPDNKHGSLFLLTKGGVLSVFEIQSGVCLFTEKVGQAMFFASVEFDGDKGGIVAVDQRGAVHHFALNEATVVNYVCSVLNNYELGINMAKRYSLPGAEGLFKQQFQRLMSQGQYDQAMQLAATSPNDVLRNSETIAALKQVNGGQALLQYFQFILKTGKLNAVESIELTKPVLMKQGAAGLEHIKEWLRNNKLEPSEELGNELKSFDINLALSVYLRAKVPEKVIGCFLSLAATEPSDEKAQEHLNNILEYSKRVSFQPEYSTLVSQLLRVNKDRAKDFALLLINHEGGPKLDTAPTVDMFYRAGDVKNATNLLLHYLKKRGDQAEDAALQTRLFEMNLMADPRIADALFDMEDCRLTHFDRLRIARLCENAMLLQRALEFYTDIVDIKRVLGNTHALDPAFLLEFFGRMEPAVALDCLNDMLKFNMQQNIRLVVEVAKKWNDYLGADNLVKMFESFQSYNGLFFYLGSFVNETDSTSVVFKYIQAATKLNQIKEVERVCRENNHYDPKEVKEFLLQQNLRDPRPLIHVCDRFDFVDELTAYLYNNQFNNFIEAYVQRMNLKAAPPVIGALLDLNAPDDQIRKILESVRPPGDDDTFIENLVEQVEKRNRLKLLRNWLEGRASEGSTDPHLYNGLAKIYVDVNNNPKNFLETNKLYQSKVVGKYCESRDPHLAFIAYKRAWGECDAELIDVTNKNGFFKDQARYLVERQDLDLWATVLEEKNEYRRQLIDQVVATALPESRVPEEVSTTVKAFMAANLPNELIELLERIILHGPADGEFQQNKNLQNLLILTAIKADKKRVMDYIKRLENYDGPDIAKIALAKTDSEQSDNLFEEAFYIYKKFKKGPEAIAVLLDNIGSMERAAEFAEYWEQPEVWSILAKAQLDAGQAKDAIKSFLKADDASHHEDVINAAKNDEIYDDLIQFLKMARSKLKEPSIDNELIYCYAKSGRLADMEEFITQSNVAKIGDCGEQCFAEELYEAARILFNHVNNNARLAVTLVKLSLFNEAVEAARKANAIPTWKAVCFACVDAGQFRLAAMCGVNIIVYHEHMMELIRHYEINGHFEELIALLEQGINLDRAHQGIYTQLGIMYAKYKEEKLMEHIKLFWSRLNIPTLIDVCKQNLHWPEVVFLDSHYDRHDQAVEVMMTHSAECWRHDLFKEIIGKVSNTEVYYRAIDFYLSEHPLLLNDLLLDLSGKLDHTRVVTKLRQEQQMPLAQKYLLHIQRENVTAVNEAINQLWVHEENYKALRDSIDNFKQFDQVALAQSLEKHELLEFRRLSVYLYRLNKRYERSIELAKKDQLWADAMETAAESKDQALAERLLYFFVDKGEKECFAACLYVCYELIRPDVVLECAWRYNLMDFAMPFMVQTFRDYDDKLNTINSRFSNQDKEAAEKVAAEKKAKDDLNASAAAAPVMPGFGTPMLALAPPSGMMPGFGAPQQYPPVGLGGYPAQPGFY